MDFINALINIMEWLLLVYLGSAAFYVLFFSVAGHLPKSSKVPANTTPFRKYAILIPGYKEDNVILEVAGHAVGQNYPPGLFDVIVIADSFQADTLAALKKIPIVLVEVSFEVSTKSKALNAAMESLGDGYDVALILDADNLMEPDFIRKMDAAFDDGFRVAQGHRVAKNTNTPFAVLDAISEEVNNHIFRNGHRAVGLSSALIGSGMCFEYSFFKSAMASINAVGGFDKELELTLLRDGNKIEYVHDALVYDEKIQKAAVFANQRKRWLSAQFIYFRRFVFSGFKELVFHGNIDFFDKVYQMIAPPRVLLAGLVVLITAFYHLIYFLGGSYILTFSPKTWLGISIWVVIAFTLSIPRKFYTTNTLHALLTLPKAFVLMFLSLFKLKNANKKFIHTQHGTLNP